MDSETQALYDFFDSQVSHDEYNVEIVTWYLNAIQKPLLTEEEEKKLMERIKLGDKKARHIFIERNLRLVVFVAKRYIGRGLDFMDLIEEGNIGLINAVGNFNINANVRFSTYAVPAIERTILRGIIEKARNVRIPTSKYRKVSDYIKAKSELTGTISEEPTISEVAEYLKISYEEAEKLEYLRKDMAINISELAVREENEDSDLYEHINTPVYEMNTDTDISIDLLNKELYRLFNKAGLKEREIPILEHRFGINKDRRYTLEETAKIFNLTRQRISQIEHNAIEKLQTCKEAEELAIYTDNPDYSIKKLRRYRRKSRKNKQ